MKKKIDDLKYIGKKILIYFVFIFNVVIIISGKG